MSEKIHRQNNSSRSSSTPQQRSRFDSGPFADERDKPPASPPRGFSLTDIDLYKEEKTHTDVGVDTARQDAHKAVALTQNGQAKKEKPGEVIATPKQTATKPKTHSEKSATTKERAAHTLEQKAVSKLLADDEKVAGEQAIAPRFNSSISPKISTPSPKL